MPKYKIIKGEGLEATIEKSEHAPTEFEAKNVKDHLDAVSKTIDELEAKIRLEEAMVTNIERNNKGLNKINDKLKQACYLLLKSKLALVPANDKLKELKDSLKEYKKELKEIKDQTGIDIWKTSNKKK